LVAHCGLLQWKKLFFPSFSLSRHSTLKDVAAQGNEELLEGQNLVAWTGPGIGCQGSMLEL
jgi:hypothetical protein